MQKVLINKCNHGFTLSDAQIKLFPQGTPLDMINRADPRLVASFEAGDNRGDGGSTLRLVEIPDGATYHIVESDGVETLYWVVGDEMHEAE